MKIAKLGAFVLAAVAALILGLYYIGSKKNVFHSSITVSANFKNVGGLMTGNNVRFNGINVGIITKVYAISDTLIKVEFNVDEEETKYISKSSIASIGTDGMLGNKLINISTGKIGSSPIQQGNVLIVVDAIEADKALRTLTITNDNIKIISDNLKDVSSKINNNNSMWNLLSDTIMSDDIRNAVVNFKMIGHNSAVITGNFSSIVQRIKKGKGTLGTLLMDTVMSNKLNKTIVNIQSISDTMAIITGNFNTITSQIKNKKSSLNTLLYDTAFQNNLSSSMVNIKNSTASFNENMVALQHNFLLKKYFKAKDKK
jgi:phospholipid/cholesterol/gamma-HCH transport system substrate-binding protein